MTFIEAEEAREVGLLEGTYQSSHIATSLQEALDDEEDQAPQA